MEEWPKSEVFSDFEIVDAERKKKAPPIKIFKLSKFMTEFFLR